MNIHPMRGALFENMLVAEYGKHCRNQGHANTMYFWRDNTGNEVDLLIERAGELWPVEIKIRLDVSSRLASAAANLATPRGKPRRGQPMLISAVPGNITHPDATAAHWCDALEALAPR